MRDYSSQWLLDGFANAKDAIKQDPDVLGVYLPLLSKLDLHIFEVCKNADELAKSLVKEWLRKYLLKNEADPLSRATEVAKQCILVHCRNAARGNGSADYSSGRTDWA